MQTVLLAREIGRLMAWDVYSKKAVNTHFCKVGNIRRAFDCMGALTIDNVFRSVILVTLESSNNRALHTAHDQILDNLINNKDLTFTHIQTVCARKFRRTKE
jgi:ATP-dependent protease HslVU (ClpYQ) ATPase subunit